MTINNIARYETEENLNKLVENLNLTKVEDLLLRFNFNENVLKDLVIHVSQKKENQKDNVEVALLLFSKLSKKVKEELKNEIKEKSNLGNSIAKELLKRLDK